MVFDIVQALDVVIRGRDLMRLPKPIHFARSLIVALMVAVAVTAFGIVASAAEGPKLSPAEYKSLPVGTVVKYDQWGFRVKSTDGFEIAFRELNVSKWSSIYAIFGRQGSS